jgi:mono/diheme cytochrome c family protein
MRRLFSIATACFFALLLAPASRAQSQDHWKHAVSASDRARTNPLAGDVKAAEGGAKLYSEHCSRCHGDHADGRGRKPSLRGPDTTDATDGELFWILKNGDLVHSMPDWAQLPETQRWQLVTYLRSLQIAPNAAAPTQPTPAP